MQLFKLHMTRTFVFHNHRILRGVIIAVQFIFERDDAKGII